jgi:hypothetical protein
MFSVLAYYMQLCNVNRTCSEKKFIDVAMGGTAHELEALKHTVASIDCHACTGYTPLMEAVSMHISLYLLTP